MKARATALFTILALMTLTGCGSITGRSAGTWASDKATTAKVKTALAGTRAASMTKVDVDTNSGVVFLTGRVATEQTRQDIVRAAELAAGGKQVVSNLTVIGEPMAAAPAAAASPPTATGAAGVAPQPAPSAQMAPSQRAQPQQGYIVYGPQGYYQQAPPPAQQAPPPAAGQPPITSLRFSRVVPDAYAAGRYAAFDATGKQVATVYALTSDQLRQRGVSDLETGKKIDHVSIYPQGGSDMQYVVLWHVDREEAARLTR